MLPAIVAGDPASSRTVYAIVIGLAVIGVVLVVLAIWIIRQTRVDPELLSPLEAMADRRWRKLDPAGRRRMLDGVRPEGATPVHNQPTEPDYDDEFAMAEQRIPSFDDLPPVTGEDPTEEPAEPQPTRSVAVDESEMVLPAITDWPTIEHPIDLNEGSTKELAALPGVGPTTATAIVSEREDNGPFRNVDDLARVPGIGEAKVAAMRGLVTVGMPDALRAVTRRSAPGESADDGE
ncbi:MAG: ComEA family DNA-binding protein [Ilumatobacteraceae bacterium]